MPMKIVHPSRSHPSADTAVHGDQPKEARLYSLCSMDISFPSSVRRVVPLSQDMSNVLPEMAPWTLCGAVISKGSVGGLSGMSVGGLVVSGGIVTDISALLMAVPPGPLHARMRLTAVVGVKLIVPERPG